MSVTKAYALVVSVVLAGGLAVAASPESSAGTTAAPPVVRLKTITSRVTSTGTSLVIEASDPVAYVATRPDPLTLYIDFRNVAADGLASFVANAKGPIVGVAVEPGDVAGGSPRIRVNLSQPVAHRVRAERNTVVIDFDRATGKAAPCVLPPGSVDPITALGLNTSASAQRSADQAAILASSASSQRVTPRLQAQSTLAQAPTPTPNDTGTPPAAARPPHRAASTAIR